MAKRKGNGIGGVDDKMKGVCGGNDGLTLGKRALMAVMRFPRFVFRGSRAWFHFLTSVLFHLVELFVLRSRVQQGWEEVCTSGPAFMCILCMLVLGRMVR